MEPESPTNPAAAAGKRSADEAGLAAPTASAGGDGRSAVRRASAEGDGTAFVTAAAMGSGLDGPAALDTSGPSAQMRHDSSRTMDSFESLEVPNVIKELNSIIEKLYARALKIQEESFSMFQQLAKIQAMYNEWVQSVLQQGAGTSGAVAGGAAAPAPGSGSVAAPWAAPGMAVNVQQQFATTREVLAQHAAAISPPSAAAPSNLSWDQSASLVADLMKIVNQRSGQAAALPSRPPPPLSPLQPPPELAATLSAMQRMQRTHMSEQINQHQGAASGSGFAYPAPPAAARPGSRTITTGGSAGFRNLVQQPGQPVSPNSLASAMALPVSGPGGTGGAGAAAGAGASLAAAASMLSDPTVLSSLPNAVDSLSPEAAALLLSLLSGAGVAGPSPPGSGSGTHKPTN